MKNILFISPTGTLDNGAEISITYLMEFLVKEKNYNVYNIYPENGHPSQSDYTKRMEDIGVVSKKLFTLEWWWPEAPEPSNYTLEEKNLFYHENLYLIRQFIHQNKIDLVISNTVNVFYGALAAAFEGLPHYWLIHEFPDAEFEYYKEKLPFIIQNSEKVFAVEGNLVKRLNELIKPNFKDQIESFIPYTKVERTQLEESNSHRIISIGKINVNKNQLELIKAYQNLNLTIPLIFIGGWDEDYKSKCDDYIRQNKLSNISFTGHKNNPWLEVRNKDVVILNSKMETFGLVYVESILNNLPTIISNNPGYMSAYKFLGKGLHYELGKQDNLTEQIKNVLANYEFFKQDLVKNNTVLLDKFSIESCFKNVINAITVIAEDKLKSINALSSVIASSNQNQSIINKFKESITIYFSDSNNFFSQEKSILFPAREMDMISFTLPSDAHLLRIDITENANALQKVRLIDVNNNKVIIPNDSNGHLINETVVFLENDPQLYFDCKWIGSNLVLEYETLNINSQTGRDFYRLIIDRIVKYEQEKSEYNLDFSTLNNKYRELEQKFSYLEQQYNAVINSRRWTIPSKILAFFRRRK